MKKVFFALALMISLSSCVSTRVSKVEPSLPIEVKALQNANKYDTMLVINTEHKKYLFNDKNEYIGCVEITDIRKDNDESGWFVFLIFFVCFLFGFLVA